MISVIGLGNAGCKIADLLNEHEQYEVYKIDTDLEKKNNCLSIPERQSAQDYEEKFPTKVASSLKKIKTPVVLVVAGGGKISHAGLRALECVSDNPIEILYIRPDVSTSGPMEITRDKIVFGILQQYARSGVFERMYVVCNSDIERVVGAIPLSQYYQKINSVISSTFHMLNVYKNLPANFSNFLESDDISRISTIGVGTIEKMADQLFFPLKFTSEKNYYFAISQKQLDEDPNLLSNIKRRVKQNDPTIRTGFGVYPTPYDQNYIYILANTKIIQGVDYDE